MCSRPEGAAKVVPHPRHKLAVTSPSRDCPPVLRSMQRCGLTWTGSQWVLAPGDLLFPKPRAFSPCTQATSLYPSSGSAGPPM